MRRALAIKRLFAYLPWAPAARATAVAIVLLGAGGGERANAADSGQLDVTSTASSSVSLVIPERVTFAIETVTEINAETGEVSLAVVGGEFDQFLTGGSYLDGATEISIEGGGDDGAFELESAAGNTIKFQMVIETEEGTQVVSPSQLLSIKDYKSLKIELLPGEDGDLPEPDETFSGVLTITISPT